MAALLDLVTSSGEKRRIYLDEWTSDLVLRHWPIVEEFSASRGKVVRSLVFLFFRFFGGRGDFESAPRMKCQGLDKTGTGQS